MSARRNRPIHRLGGERGAVAVEFALVVPLLLVLLFSIVSVSRAFQVQATLSGAAREAARAMAIQNDSGAARSAAVFAASAASVPLTAGQVSISPSTCTGASPKTNVVVTITYQFKPTGSFAGGVAFPITSKAVLRCGG
ncbi:TadE/TadG family type IV pilus assembly protein [Blastococcus tunisiensis]|uniref:TadE-like protein n=1 Tax=Blastococcus tunisiensis TaxID=1798228 RepID=A0A1I2G8B3_9ACTN|nr:TadE/TadG family type IV pilus assembly protein [Blastococcus sp. DSM 46838]SFF13772.1 TadE-like protein [Blastococcus sp. DSM 46838]